jgi:hypothetical protein
MYLYICAEFWHIWYTLYTQNLAQLGNHKFIIWQVLIRRQEGLRALCRIFEQPVPKGHRELCDFQKIIIVTAGSYFCVNLHAW